MAAAPLATSTTLLLHSATLCFHLEVPYKLGCMCQHDGFSEVPRGPSCHCPSVCSVDTIPALWAEGTAPGGIKTGVGEGLCLTPGEPKTLGQGRGRACCCSVPRASMKALPVTSSTWCTHLSTTTHTICFVRGYDSLFGVEHFIRLF